MSTPYKRSPLNVAFFVFGIGCYQGRDQGLFVAPLYFNRAGNVNSDALSYPGNSGYFWSSTVSNSSDAYGLSLYSTYVNSANDNLNRYYGRSVRWVVVA